MSHKNIEFKGELMGVRLVPRGQTDRHISVQMLIEDDEHWHDLGSRFSSSWIGELIEQLQEAKKYMKTQERSMHKGKQYGYQFKDEV